MKNIAYRVPTDEDIASVEAMLNFKFPDAYTSFLKSRNNMVNEIYEPALVLPGIDRLYIVNVAHKAWATNNISREWLPFIEDNGDYFLVAPTGEVRYWSRNGAATERWLSFSEWFQKCCTER